MSERVEVRPPRSCSVVGEAVLRDRYGVIARSQANPDGTVDFELPEPADAPPVRMVIDLAEESKV